MRPPDPPPRLAGVPKKRPSALGGSSHSAGIARLEKALLPHGPRHGHGLPYAALIVLGCEICSLKKKKTEVV